MVDTTKSLHIKKQDFYVVVLKSLWKLFSKYKPSIRTDVNKKGKNTHYKILHLCIKNTLHVFIVVTLNNQIKAGTLFDHFTFVFEFVLLDFFS